MSGELHDVMLAVPDPVTKDGTVLAGDVGDVVRGVHWAEAQAAARDGLVVIVDHAEDELRQMLH